MAEKTYYKEVWDVLTVLLQITNESLDAIVSKEYLANVNDIICTYSKVSAPRLVHIFETLMVTWEDSEKRAEAIKTWNAQAQSICAMQLAISLYDMDNIEIPEVGDILEFYLDANISVEVKALGLYNLASTFRSGDAQLCYELQSKSFEIYPQLAKALGVDYVYNAGLIKDQYFDICPICGGNHSTAFYCVPQFIGLKTGSHLAPLKLWKKCSECNNLYAYNFPISEMGEMNGHYTISSTYSTIEPRYGLRVYSDIFNKCQKYTTGKKYLEIGIGRGEMLAAALEMGYEVDAVEICKEDCEKVSSVLGIDVKWCDFINFETNQKYDIIIMGDVLEHVSAPIKALEKVQSLLNSGGVLWLSTPNYNSAFSRLKKFTDPMWNQKNHFTYFSYENLLPFLNKLNLEVKRYDVSNRFNGSMELYCVKNE